MHVLLVADGRSPTTRGWIRTLRELDCRVTLVSSFPASAPEGVDNCFVIPVAFAGMSGAGISGAGMAAAGSAQAAGPSAVRQSSLRLVIGRFRPLFMAGRYVLGPWSVDRQAGAFAAIVRQVQPDLVHALRIPFEGMLASGGPRAGQPENLPLVVSIWGNDLTLHARGSPWMRALTRRTLQRADGLLADAARDLCLGREWGLREGTPSLVVPGSGGLRLDEIRARGGPVDDLLGEILPDVPAGDGAGDFPIVLNPRGLRPGSLRTDSFFRSVPLLLARAPQARVVCAAMQGQPEAEAWRRRLDLPESGPGSLRLLPALPQDRLWDLFHRAQVLVSPGAHDGTPNSLLEGMACGCFPVAGDIESLREWIRDGENGRLVDPADPASLAEAAAQALESPELRREAARVNACLVEERAGVEAVRGKVGEFYNDVISGRAVNGF